MEAVQADPAEKYELHPKVGMSVVAGALVNVAIGVLNQTGTIDLSPYQGDLTLVVMGVVAYFTPSPT